jgi:hypothetical protein
MENYIYTDKLRHSGTKGMKWYQRLYQNYDGSLTPLGRLRYGVGPARKSSGGQTGASATTKKKTSSGKVEAANKSNTSGESTASNLAESVVAKARSSSVKKSTRNMTDEELKKSIERLRLEIEYKQKTDELSKLKAKDSSKTDSKSDAQQSSQGNKQSNNQSGNQQSQNNKQNNQSNNQSSKNSAAVIDNHKNDPVPAKNDNKNSAAKDFVKKVLYDAGKEVATQAAKYAMGTAINTMMGEKVISFGKVIPRSSETNEAPKVKSDSKPASSDEKKKKK